MTTTSTESRTPTEAEVIHALARRFYLDYSNRKGWIPHPYPYCDPASIRYAEIAVAYLGFEDDVDIEVR